MPKGIPPAGDETIPPAKFVPSAALVSEEEVVSDADDAAVPDGPYVTRARVCGNVVRGGSGSRTGISDALVPSSSDALPSKSIFRGGNEGRNKGVKLHCHKQIVCAVIEPRRNHENRAVSMLPSKFSTTGSSQLAIGSCSSPAVAGLPRARQIQASVSRCRRGFAASDFPLGIPL